MAYAHSNEAFNDELKEYTKRHGALQVVSLTAEDLKKAQDWAERFARYKMGQGSRERTFAEDNGKLVKRTITGKLGEMALEKLLGQRFSSTALGDTRKFDTPDLAPLGIAAGIKTVEMGKFPVVSETPKYPEIITLLHWKDGLPQVAVLGVATPALLKGFSDSSHILDKNMLGRKTAFTGLAELTPFPAENRKQFLEKVAEPFKQYVRPPQSRNAGWGR